MAKDKPLHEMTQQEYHEWRVRGVDWSQMPQTPAWYRKRSPELHEQIVATAMAMGKPIPSKVLRQYPKLKFIKSNLATMPLHKLVLYGELYNKERKRRLALLDRAVAAGRKVPEKTLRQHNNLHLVVTAMEKGLPISAKWLGELPQVAAKLRRDRVRVRR